jgi:hypothetical protein
VGWFMTIERLLVIVSQIVARYPYTTVQFGRRRTELMVLRGGQVIVYIDIESGEVHPQPGIEL